VVDPAVQTSCAEIDCTFVLALFQYVAKDLLRLLFTSSTSYLLLNPSPSRPFVGSFVSLYSCEFPSIILLCACPTLYVIRVFFCPNEMYPDRSLRYSG